MSNKEALEKFIVDELKNNKVEFNIPPEAKIKVIYSTSRVIETEYPFDFYFYAEIRQDRYYAQDFSIKKDSVSRDVHVISNKLTSTKAIKSLHNVLDVEKFEGIFGIASDGDLNGNLDFYQEGLKLLVHQNINYFYLNAPKSLLIDNIKILEVGEDVMTHRGYCIYVSIDKILKEGSEEDAVLKSNVRCKFFRTSFPYDPIFGQDYVYSLDIGNGKDYRTCEDEINKYLADPMNMVFS